jgi:signal transduction histidine kinase
MRFELRPVDIRQAIQAALQGVAPMAKKKCLDIRLCLPENQRHVLADGAGSSLEAGAEPVYIRVTVSDSGVGIPQHQLGQIFDKFKQVSDKVSGKPMGTGLGLAITKELVEKMGGKIWVESTPGAGTDFHFTLPTAVEAVATAAAPQTSSLNVK